MKVYIVERIIYSADSDPNQWRVIKGIYTEREDAVKKFKEQHMKNTEWECGGDRAYILEANVDEEYKEVNITKEVLEELEKEKNNTPKNVKVLLIPQYMSDKELAKANIHPSATVEAEYGEKVIKGSEVTLAHHTEEYKNNPAPCNTPDVPVLSDNSTIVISHIDLDTLGGIAALMGRKKEDSDFWKTAEFIDLNGPHNLFQVPEDARKKYVAYQAYQANNRMPRYTEVVDVTEFILEDLEIIDKIIDGDKTLIQDGIKWDEETKKKIEDCLIFENDNVRVFDSPEGVFCSASYYSEKQGKVIPSTVTRNGKFKSITVAMADGGKKLSAKEIVQELWGNEAGGHTGIAGSPRGQEMTREDLQKLSETVNEKYNEIKHIDIKKENHSIEEIEETILDRKLSDVNKVGNEIVQANEEKEHKETNKTEHDEQ